MPNEKDADCEPKPFGRYSTYLFNVRETTTTSTQTKTTTTHTESMQFSRHMQDLIDEALASQGKFAEKAVVVDLAKGLEELEVAIEKEVAARTSQADASAASLQAQNDKLLAALEKQAQTAKEERDVLYDRLYALTRRLDALEAPPQPVGDSGGDGNGDGGSSSIPAEIVADGSSGSVTVRGGNVLFESNKCSVTDLCEIQGQVQALMNKFNGTA